MVVCCGGCGPLGGKQGGEGIKHSVDETNTLRSRQPVEGGEGGTVLRAPTALCLHRSAPNCRVKQNRTTAFQYSLGGGIEECVQTPASVSSEARVPYLWGWVFTATQVLSPIVSLVGSPSPWACLLSVVVLRVPKPRLHSLCWGCSCVVLRCCLWPSGHLRGHWLVSDGCGGVVLFGEGCPLPRHQV